MLPVHMFVSHLKKCVLFLSVIIFFSVSCTQKNSTIPPGELDINSSIQPVPESAKFIDDSLYIWGGSLVQSHNDKKYHLFYSRWPREYGFSAWVTHSEIAHAVSDSPFGPYKFKNVALPPRGNEYWDGMVTHNPTVYYFNGKYYLYYMGNIGDGVISGSGLNWVHRNNQRIGVAVTDDPNGPWQRTDTPLIDVSPDSTALDALMTSNPSVTQMPDGRFLMIYKGVAKQREMPFGGPVMLLTAIADSPTGPFVKQLNPVFTAPGFDFPAEDPYVWHDGTCYYAILSKKKGAFTEAGRSMILFYSLDGAEWKLAKNPLVSDLEIKWENGTVQKLIALERPQLLFQDGKPIALLCAANETPEHSFNVQIPLNINQ